MLRPNIHTGILFSPESSHQVDGYLMADGHNVINMAICYILRDQDIDKIKKLTTECIIRSLGLPGHVEIEARSSNRLSTYLTDWNELDSAYKEHLSEHLPKLDKALLQHLYKK